jgi:hypothetical protein
MSVQVAILNVDQKIFIDIHKLGNIFFIYQSLNFFEEV